jgi:GxxExxY protein
LCKTKFRALKLSKQSYFEQTFYEDMMKQTEKRIGNDTLTEQIIGAAIQVHRELGPGLLESAYEVCLCHELLLSDLKIERQKVIPIFYKGIKLDAGYRLDLVVEEQVIVEIKAVSELLPVHEAQLLSYLKQAGGGRGLLINFNVKLLKHGIRRLIV